MLRKTLIFWLIIINYTSLAFGLTFTIPYDSDIVGNLQTTKVTKGKSLGEIGRQFDIGVYEMIEANPNLNPWVPKIGATVVIPSEFILPPGKRQGLVINLAEMRIYYFHPNENKVSTHPIGIGRKGWNTPLGSAHIIQKKALPYWQPPTSIRKEHIKNGDPLPSIVPPGPDNPLGEYAMRLSIPGYLIHGTNRPGGIGVRSTSGCIRLFPEDIQTLFPQIAIGTPVRIIHAPYKFGHRGYSIFLEAHQPLSDHYHFLENKISLLKQALEEAMLDSYVIDWNYAEKKTTQPQGYPVLIH
jgi:L,D-transpeptidase ErfK/SrfK